MKSFQYLTTVIALTLLASHQIVAAPASENQAQSDSQSAAFPIGKNQIEVITGNFPSDTVVVSSDRDGNIEFQQDGTNVVELNPTESAQLAKNIADNVHNQVKASGDLATKINNYVDNQIETAFDNVRRAVDDVDV